MKIVDAGSLSRAATTLFVAQPALSQQMAELEAELGVALLLRSARGVRATPAGEVLYREASAILHHVAKLPDLVRDSGGAVAGAVGLGMSSTLASFIAGPFIEACRAALPGVGLSFVTEDSATLKARLAAQGLDLAVVFEEAPTPGQMRIALFRQRLYLVDRKRLPGGARTVSLQRLASMPLVLASPPNIVRGVLDRAFAELGARPDVVAETNLLASMLAAVQAGVGATVVPMGDVGAAFGRGALVATPIEPAMYLTAYIVSADDRPLTRGGEAVRALLASFVARLMQDQAPAGMEPVET